MHWVLVVPICWFVPVNIAELASLFRITEPVFQEFAALADVALKAEYDAAITPLPVPTIATPAAMRPERRPIRRVIFSMRSPENVRAASHPSRLASTDNGRATRRRYRGIATCTN